VANRVILAGVLSAGLLLPSVAAAGPALLFDSQSGLVLYAEDQDDQWYPASLTKIMTAYLVFEALKSGQLALDTKARYSEAAFAQPPSKVGLPVGAEMAIDTALKALIIKSANDIAVLLAEAVSGTEAQFVAKMNETAQRLGMTRTRFANANGLPAPEQVTTARDLARLSRAVVRDFPEYAHYWSMLDMRLGKVRMATHNQLLRTFEGGDGMKTGFICDSGYNLIASATRDGVRLMAVVLGERTGSERAIRAQSLLEHGFSTHGWKALFNSPTIDTATTASDAKDVTSVRSVVRASDCGGARVRVARQKTKQVVKAAAATTEGSATKEAGAEATAAGSAAKTGAAPKVKPKAKAAPAVPATPAAAAVEATANAVVAKTSGADAAKSKPKSSSAAAAPAPAAKAQ
jgi:D-alanyl-D-alanine carboxypeptidase